MWMVFDLKDDWTSTGRAADVGWITGHSYIVYGPLANGATSIMYEGAPDYPERDRWWKDRRALQGLDPLHRADRHPLLHEVGNATFRDGHDLSSLRLLGSVGEPINPEAWIWYQQVIGGSDCPIVDTWWQTETGAIMISPLPGLTPAKPGSATLPIPGVSATVRQGRPGDRRRRRHARPDPSLAEHGAHPVEGTGPLRQDVLRPLRPRVYLVGDAARRDEDGYFWIIGRIDDVINVSGHSLSTTEIESALVSHPSVAEAAVIGVPDEATGQAVAAYVTVVGGVETGQDMSEELRETWVPGSASSPARNR